MSSCFLSIFGGCHQGPIASTGLVFNLVLGLRLGSAHLLFLMKLFFFLTGTGLERMGVVGLDQDC